MKRMISWFLLFILFSALLAGGTHLYYTRNPRKVIIAFDDSSEMKKFWPRVPEAVSFLEKKRYTLFLFLSNKEKITPRWTLEPDWEFFRKDRPFLGVYRPKDLINPLKYPEINDAHRIYILTPAPVPEDLENDPRVRLLPLE